MVEAALDDLGFLRKRVKTFEDAGFTASCDVTSTDELPRFTLTSNRDVDLYGDGKLILKSPVIYFAKNSAEHSGHWTVTLYSETSLAVPDSYINSTVATPAKYFDGAETIGRYNSNDMGSWTLRTASLDEWVTPFDHSWLTTEGVGTLPFTFTNGRGTALEVSADCTVSLHGMQSEPGKVRYIFDGNPLSDPNVLVVELEDANEHTLISAIDSSELLSSPPTTLRDFRLTENLLIIVSDADGVSMEGRLPFDTDVATLDAGYTYLSLAKLVPDSRLHSAVGGCTGTDDQFWHVAYHVGSDGQDYVRAWHAEDVTRNDGAWTLSGLTFTGSWLVLGTLRLLFSGTLSIALRDGEVLDLALDATYTSSATSLPTLTGDDASVDGLVGLGLSMIGVHAEFAWDSKEEECAVYLTGDLVLPQLGGVAMRGVTTDKSPTNAYWRSASAFDGLSVGAYLTFGRQQKEEGVMLVLVGREWRSSGRAKMQPRVGGEDLCRRFVARCQEGMSPP